MVKWRVEYVRYGNGKDWVFFTANEVVIWKDPNNPHNRDCVLADGVIVDMQYPCVKVVALH